MANSSVGKHRFSSSSPYTIHLCSLLIHQLLFVSGFYDCKMCIAAFVWQAHLHYPLILLQNRDEYHSRPTEPAAWWDHCDILAGRDGVAGGTWLGCSRTGKVAFLTNVLDLHTVSEGKSRGELPVLFLQSTKSPKEFAEELAKRAHLYKGFNMIVADIPSKTMLYISNRPRVESAEIQEVPPGMHVLSNAKLDSPSYKAQRLWNNLKSLLCDLGEGEILLNEIVDKIMKDRTTADKSRLLGIFPVEWEVNLSSIFVEMDTHSGRYGTRSSIALTVKASRDVSFYESYLEDETWKERTISFRIEQS